MKKILIIAAVAMTTVVGYSQGRISVQNGVTGFFQPIFGVNPLDPLTRTSGNPLNGQPNLASGASPAGGSTIYGGSLLQGTGFTFAFLGGSTTANLTQLFSTTFRTATAFNKLPAGLISGVTTVIMPTVDAGQSGFYQIVAWNNAGGTLTTWQQAQTASADAGFSGIFATGPLGGTDVNGNVFPVNPATTAWTSFSLASVPEPTSFALAGLGIAAMLINRRRK